MLDNNEMQELSFFDIVDEPEKSDKLSVVEAIFKNVKKMDWEELFNGYDELYAITYSSGIDFISRVLPNFKYAEIIFGYEGVVDSDVAMMMSIQFSQLKFICKHKSAKNLAERLENDTLKLLVSREIKSHEKIYVLKAYDRRVRVITGSANLSYSAFNGVQRENITYMDNEEAFEYYFNQFEEFKKECADNVEYKAMKKVIANPDDIVDEVFDVVPIAGTVMSQKAVVLEETPDADYIIAADAKNISKDIKPLLPQKDRKGKVVISVESISKAKRKYKQICDNKKEERKSFPKLHIDVEHKCMKFNEKECNLNPNMEDVKSDLQLFIDYMNGFNVFSGDVSKNQRTYFQFTAWYLASPFMPYLRYMAYCHGQDIKQFPVFAVLYGESNGGKTAFTKLLTKMMCGKQIPVNKSGDFTSTTIDGLKQSCEGIPIVIDDLDKTHYREHISKIVKYDEWGIKEQLLNYPSVAVTTNELSSIKSDISKRVFVCHIDSCLDKDKARANYKMINSCIKEMKTAFYNEYVRRMINRIDYMVDKMQGNDDTYLPDIFTESSNIIIQIASEILGDNLPEYMYPCEFNEYFGNKAVGRNAISKIQRAWNFEREAFKIHKRKNLLEYKVPDNSNPYVLEYIRQELPPSLNAQITARTLTMDLDAAKEFFEVDFKMTIKDVIMKR